MFTQCICNVIYKNTEPKEWRLTGDGTWVTLALSALYQSSLLNQSVAQNYLMTPVKMSLSLAQLLVSVWQKYQHTWVFFLLNFRLALQPEKEPQQVRYERDSWGKIENPALLISIHIIHATGFGMSGDITVAHLMGLMKKSRLNYLYIFQGNGWPKESETVWMGRFSSHLAVADPFHAATESSAIPALCYVPSQGTFWKRRIHRDLSLKQYRRKKINHNFSSSIQKDEGKGKLGKGLACGHFLADSDLVQEMNQDLYPDQVIGYL